MICARCGRQGSAQFGDTYDEAGQRIMACSNTGACRKRREAKPRRQATLAETNEPHA